MKKICFVIMGFGKKTDYSTGRVFNLDKTYQNIIKPTVEEAGYVCIRSDEIKHTGYIDKPMYSLLVHADLVIADISTFNPNAMYELGIRHASKPFSTIVLSEESILESYHPFDINHINTITYKHLGDDVGFSEVLRTREILNSNIASKEKNIVDSPLYEFLGGINVHQLSEQDKEEIVKLIASNEIFISRMIEKANEHMKNNEFVEAFYIWKELNEKSPKEILFVQQMALAKYKSEKPDKRTALEDAKTIISQIVNENNDSETLGIAGAICKKIYLINKDKYILKQAIEYYEKGFKLNNNYYNGENYAMCVEYMYLAEDSNDLKIHYRVLSQMIREETLFIAKDLEIELLNSDEEDKWLYATLANLYLYFNDLDMHEKYKGKFMNLCKSKWEEQTFLDGLGHIEIYTKEVKIYGTV